uniref:sensor histidine kinase n=1 Tax=Noviherbaspirillum sp. TaxID=1926288 RepID=UPI002FE3C9C3
VLCNLLDNAAKYTPAGSPLLITAAPDGTVVRVSVEDRGCGVPEEAREAIFEKFTRGATESSLAGVGLGLAICRTIIAAHGGRIWVESRSGGGAAFVFTLPAGSPPAAHGMPEWEEMHGTEGVP